MPKKRSIGRGLGALIPGREAPAGGTLVSTTGLKDIAVGSIDPNPDQPRKTFDPDSLEELVQSVKEFGVVQPVIVRGAGDRFELIAGERRWRAAKEAGLVSIQALVREASDPIALQIGLIENIQREDLNAIEEADAYRSLVADHGITQSDLAKHLGKSKATISNTLRLLSLPQPIQAAVVEGSITSGHARALLALPGENEQLAYAQRIKEERLSVREIEEIVREVAPPTQQRKSGPTKTQKAEVPQALREVAAELTTRLDIPVSVGVKGSNGFVKMTFSSAEEFSRLVGILQSLGTVDIVESEGDQ